MAKLSDAPLMLSISGLRGIIGASFTTEVASIYAAAFSDWLRSTPPSRSPERARPLVCLGRDGRRDGEIAHDAVRESLLDQGCDVIDLGVAMTPTVGVAILRHQADGAMVVTASHNPQEWNGLKALDANGLAPSPDRAAEIVKRFNERRAAATAQTQASTSRQFGAGTRTHERGELIVDTNATSAHVERALALVDVETIRSCAFSVVLDSVNASGSVGGRHLLDRLGCRVVHLHGDSSGVFPHAPEPLESNLRGLMDATAKHHASCGFAQDPDADRLAVVDDRGRYIGEEFTLALVAWRMLERHGPGVMAANLSTSRLIDRVAERFPGSRVIRTAVGEAHVAGALRRENGFVGGEGNGGVIVPAVSWVRDSLSAMALVLDLLASRRVPLSTLIAELPRVAMVKSKLDLAGVGGASAVATALERVRTAWGDAKITDIDGVRIDLADGWVHLRASNTEPILRIIAEADSDARAHELVAQCRAAAGFS